MSRRRTGAPRLRGDRWWARVPLGGERLSILLATCAKHEETKARERAGLLCALASKLHGAGHRDIIVPLLERAGREDGKRLADVLTAAERLCAGEARAPASVLTTVRAFGEQWTSGELHRRFPDHVKEKRSADDDRERLRRYVYPVVGDVSLKDFTLAHADAVMSSLPASLNPTTRRHCGQVLARLLKLAAYPARLIERSPLPPGFLPRVAQRKALAYLHPTEDAKLMACVEVDLAHRLFYGVAVREGPRRSELANMTWSQLDLDVGSVRLDENKTDDPRAWALQPDVVRALARWRALRGEPPAGGLVFADEAGKPIATSDKTHAVRSFREHLRLAGINRPELFEKSATRQPIRIHDLRASFVTLALANGRTETWVADRTGHKSSVMINRYRRAARHAAEIGLGPLGPLDQLVPELRAVHPDPVSPAPSGEEPADGDRQSVPESVPSLSQFNPLSGGGSEIPQSSQVVAEEGLEPSSPCGQRILNRGHASHDATEPRDHNGFSTPIGTDRDAWDHFRAAWDHFGPTPRARLVAVLSAAMAEAAKTGDMEAVAVAADAIARLAGPSS